MNLSDPDLDHQLRLAYYRRTGRRWKKLKSSLLEELGQSVLWALGSAALPFFYVKAFSSSITAFLGLWSLMLLARALCLASRLWSELHEEQALTLPVNPEAAFRSATLVMRWTPLGLWCENCLILTVVAKAGDWPASVFSILACASLLTFVQIGIAIVSLTIPRKPKSDPYEGLFIIAFVILGAVLLLGIAIVAGLLGYRETYLSYGGSLGTFAPVLTKILPTGWAIDPIARGLAGANGINWFASLGSLFVAIVPWLFRRRVRDIAIQSFCLRTNEYPDDDIDFDADATETTQLVDEETGERWIATRLDPELFGSKQKWEIDGRAYTAQQLQELAASEKFWELREFEHDGWIESVCLKIMNHREREALDVMLPQDIQYSKWWKKGWKWLIIFATIGGWAKLLGWSKEFTIWPIIALSIVLIIFHSPRNLSLEVTRSFAIPIRRRVITSVILKIAFVKSVAGLPPVLLTGCFAGWLAGFNPFNTATVLVMVLGFLAIQAPFWKSLERGQADDRSAIWIRLALMVGAVANWIGAFLFTVSMEFSERWIWMLPIWAGFAIYTYIALTVDAWLDRRCKIVR